MRIRSLCILAITLLTIPAARADEVEDYSHDFKTYKGTLGSDPILAEFVFARIPENVLERFTYLGRFTYLTVGKDIPLEGTAETTEQKSAGSELKLIEEAPCAPKNCQSIVPERDDEFGDLAPGEAPNAAEWRIKFDASGNTISGVRKDLKTGKSKTVSLTFVGETVVEYDCCSTNDLLRSVYSGENLDKDHPYDKNKFLVPYKSGPAKTFGNATYHMETDERIGAAFPVVNTLPGGTDVTNINAWLLTARAELYIPDFNCASRTYHGFRWNKALAKKLKNYRTKSKADIDFISDKLVGVAQTIDVDCGEFEFLSSRKFVLGDVKTGKQVDPKTLVTGLEAAGVDSSTGEPRWKNAMADTLLDKIKTGMTEAGNDDYFDCFTWNSTENLTAAFRGDQMAFTFENMPAGSACYDDILTIPLSEAGDYLNEQGKAYFAEFLK